MHKKSKGRWKRQEGRIPHVPPLFISQFRYLCWQFNGRQSWGLDVQTSVVRQLLHGASLWLVQVRGNAGIKFYQAPSVIPKFISVTDAVGRLSCSSLCQLQYHTNIWHRQWRASHAHHVSDWLMDHDRLGCNEMRGSGSRQLFDPSTWVVRAACRQMWLLTSSVVSEMDQHTHTHTGRYCCQ